MRVGHGFDAHRFCPGDHVMLGGVRIDHDHGIEAHSDGDVLIHALCDALLGAAGLGDMGTYFPDSDPNLKDVDSRHLLRQTVSLLGQQKLKLANADLTLIAQTPRVANTIEAMRTILAEDLDVPAGLLNIKATTTEGMGFVGRKEGIAAHAVVLLSE